MLMKPTPNLLIVKDAVEILDEATKEGLIKL
jgi:hypothetical protein